VRGRTLRYARERLAREPASLTLHDALTRHHAPTSGEELARIVRELHDVMARNRTGLKLVDRCAAEYPELAKLWFGEGRGALLEALTRYLQRGIQQEVFHKVPDVRVAARIIIETVVFWAVHRHWDPAPQPVDPQAAADTIVQMLVDALCRTEDKPRRRRAGSGRTRAEIESR
jgi:hypothetical protein